MLEETPKEGHVPAALPVAKPTAPVDLEQLYRDHYRQVLAAAYRVTGDASEAEDVLQTVFARLLTRDVAPDLSPSPGAYLKRAAVNAAIDVVRRRHEARRVPLVAVEASAADGPGSSPEQRQRESELRAWLQSALGRLSPSAGEVFALHLFEEMSHTEIAAALGTSANAVAVLLHRARKQLRTELEGVHGGGR